MQLKKKASLILAIALISILALNLSSAYAEQVISTKRYRDYQVEDLGNGTFRQTLGMPQYVWDGTNFVDRMINNNGTHYNVYSEMGSFSFNKADCTITQYVKGFNPIVQTAKSSDIVIKNWFWTIARKNGVNPWQIIDASTLGCNITTLSNSTGKYLTMTRSDSSGSYLKVTLAAPEGKQIEDYTQLFMNRTAWSGNKFAFVLWAKDVKADSLTFRNGTTIPIPNGITTINKTNLTVDSMSFIKNGNPFYFDWQKAKTNFKMLLLNKTGSNVDLQFGFSDNSPILTTGQKMAMDPTYGYTAATAKTIQSAAVAGAACGAGNTNNGDTFNIYLPGSGGADTCNVSVPRWSISSIPHAAIPTSITIRYGISAVTNMGSLDCVYHAMANDPNTASNAALFTDAQDGNAYANDAGCRTTGASKTIALNSTAINDLRTILAGSQNWLSYGLAFDTMVRDASNHQSQGVSAPGPYNVELQVVYNIGPPNSVTTLAASSTTASTTNLSWSAPALNNGTLQRYVINYTSPCGTPNTHLANGTTATSYAVSGLAGSTCYSFRVSAATQGGYNTTGANIVNVTTLAFNQANFTIGGFNFNAQNPALLPIRFERINNGSQSFVNVTYSNTFNLACDLKYTYAGSNHTYHTIPSTPVSASEDMSSFNFANATNDIVTFHCWDQGGNATGNYVLTQQNFLLLQQINDFRNGTYGTMGQLGALDFVSVVIVILVMIGFNKTNEAVGGFFCIVGISVITYFGIIQWQTAIVAALAVVVMLIIASTRKD